MEYLHHQIMDASFRKWLWIFSLWSIQDNSVIRCVLLLDWITNYFCYKSSEVEKGSEDPIWFLWSSWCCAVKLYFLVESQIMADNQKRSCHRLTTLTTHPSSQSFFVFFKNLDYRREHHLDFFLQHFFPIIFLNMTLMRRIDKNEWFLTSEPSEPISAKQKSRRLSRDCMIDPTKKELNHVATDFFLASVQAWQDSGCFYSPFKTLCIQGSS